MLSAKPCSVQKPCKKHSKITVGMTVAIAYSQVHWQSNVRLNLLHF